MDVFTVNSVQKFYLGKTSITKQQSGQLQQDENRTDLDERFKRISKLSCQDKDDKVFQNISNAQSYRQNVMIEKEVTPFLKQSIEDVRKEIRSLDQFISSASASGSGSKYVSQVQSQRQLPQSAKYNRTSYILEVGNVTKQSDIFSSVNKSANKERMSTIHKAKQNLEIASIINIKKRNKTSSTSWSSNNNSKQAGLSSVVVYLQLNKLFNCSYLRQVSSNQLQLFEMDRAGKAGTSRFYKFSYPIQTELGDLINLILGEMQPNQTYLFYSLNFVQKTELMERILSILSETVAGQLNIKLQLADCIYLDQASSLEQFLREYYKGITDIDEKGTLEKNIVRQLQNLNSKFDCMQKLIGDQIQYNQGTSKQIWQNVRKQIRRDICFSLLINDLQGKTLISFIFRSGKPTTRMEMTRNQNTISSLIEYNELVELTSQMQEHQVNIFCLNPQAKDFKETEQYLKVTKNYELK